MNSTTMTTTPARRTYTVNEAAAMLGISRSTAYECVQSGEIKALRLRGRIVVPAHALADLLGVQSDIAVDSGE